MLKNFKLFGRDSLRDKIVSGVAVVLFSMMLFIYFAAQNINELSLRTIGLLSIIVFSLTVISYFLFLILFRRAFRTFAFSVVFWLGFHLLPLMRLYLSAYWPWSQGGSTPFVVTVILASFCALALSFKFRITVKAIYMFIAVLIIMSTMNFRILFQDSMQENTVSNTRLPIKTDFVVDERTQSPNIYWIHADGMLGFDIVKKYYGEDQEEFRAELKERDFIINPDANFEAQRHTAYAIPILMNPYSYDNWIKDVIYSDIPINKYFFFVLRNNSELQNALASKNYALNIISNYGYYYPMNTGNLWLTGFSQTRKQIFSYDDIRNNWLMEASNFNHTYIERIVSSILKRTDFKGRSYKAQIPLDKMKDIFKNGWNASDIQFDFAAALYDILYGDYSTPRLTIIHDVTPHYPYEHDKDGTKLRNDKTRSPLYYYPQHKWSADILIKIIDMILEIDFASVIVIQSDHGMHGTKSEEFHNVFGDKANDKELWNSTISAIRVPSKFKTGEEDYTMKTPLNITRYLVNSFVGKNYDYLEN